MTFSMSGIAFVDGDYQNHTAWFNQLDENLQAQKGAEVGQTGIVAEAPVYSSEFLLEQNLTLPDSHFVHDQAAHRSDFHIIAEKTDGSIADGDFVRVGLVLGDNANVDPAYEELARVQAERVSSTAGRVLFYTLNAGEVAETAPITLDGANQRVGFQDESPSYEVDVGGKVKADEYRQGGSLVSGLWTVGTGKVIYSGDARAAKSLIATGTSQPFRAASTTKVANLNVPELQGYGWPDILVEHNVTTPVTIENAGTKYPVFNLEFSLADGHRNGWYFIDASAILTVDTGDQDYFFYLQRGPTRVIKSSSNVLEEVQIPFIDVVEVTGLESADQTVTITLQKIDARQIGESTVTGYAYAAWVAPPTPE